MPPGVHLASLLSAARRRGGLRSHATLRKWLAFPAHGPRANIVHIAFPNALENADDSVAWPVDEEPSDSAPFVEDVTEEYAYPDQVIQQSTITRANNALRKAVEEGNIAAAEMLLAGMNRKGVPVEQNVIYENVTTYYLKELEVSASTRTTSFQKTLDRALLWWCLVPDKALTESENSVPDFEALIRRLLHINLLPTELTRFVFVSVEKGYASRLNTIIDHVIAYSSADMALKILTHINCLDVRVGREVRAKAGWEKGWIGMDGPSRSSLFGNMHPSDSFNLRRRIENRLNRAVRNFALTNRILTAQRLLLAMLDNSPGSIRSNIIGLVLNRLHESKLSQEYDKLAQRVANRRPRDKIPPTSQSPTRTHTTSPIPSVLWRYRQSLFSDVPPSIPDISAFMRRCHQENAIQALRAMEGRISWRLKTNNPRNWKPVILWFSGQMQMYLDDGRYEDVIQTFANCFRLQGVPGQSIIFSFLLWRDRTWDIVCAKPSNSLVSQPLRPTSATVRILLQALLQWGSIPSPRMSVATKQEQLLKEMFHAFEWRTRHADAQVDNVLDPGVLEMRNDSEPSPATIPPDIVIFDTIFRRLSSQRLWKTVRTVKETLRLGLSLPVSTWSIILYRITLHGDGPSALALLRSMTPIDPDEKQHPTPVIPIFGRPIPNLPKVDFATYLHAISAAWRGRHLNLFYDIAQMLKSSNLTPANEWELQRLQFYLNRYTKVATGRVKDLSAMKSGK